MAFHRVPNEGLTVLDRLLWQPLRAGETEPSGDPLIHSIARDLEALVNSRRGEVAMAEYPEVETSIANFGMPALSGYGDIGTGAEQNRLCRAIEDAVRTFEPRLKRAQVSVAKASGERRSVVRFRLSATVAGLDRRDIFELRLKPETGEMTVAAES